MAANDLDSAIEQSHAAGDAILKGDPSGYKTLYSDREDVTLGNPFGPYARGRKKVEETLDGAASHYRDGEFTGVDLIAKYASDDLACISRGGTGAGQSWRWRGTRPGGCACDKRVSVGARRLEARSSARGSDYDASPGGVGNRKIAKRTSGRRDGVPGFDGGLRLRQRAETTVWRQRAPERLHFAAGATVAATREARRWPRRTWFRRP